MVEEERERKEKRKNAGEQRDGRRPPPYLEREVTHSLFILPPALRLQCAAMRRDIGRNLIPPFSPTGICMM